MNIEDIQVDQPFRGYLFIKDAQVRTTKNNTKFIKLVLTDKDFNEITGFLWNATEDDIRDFKQGIVAAVTGKGKSFNDTLQLDIQRIRTTNEGDMIDLSEYIEVAPEEPKDMYQELVDTINNFENEDIKQITLKSLELHKDKLDYYPAAKTVHHALKGGLLYHTVSMLRLAKELAKLYPFLNEDLLYAGVILHDLGKTEEMNSDVNGNVSDYSAHGKLIGHIPGQISELELLGSELGTDEEVLMLLEHMILSHHYEPEYGSPKRPMFPEAEVLHHIDVIDARMNTMNKYRKAIQPGSFSERIITLDNINLYRPSFDKEN